MMLDNQIALCTYHYEKWKNLALSAADINQSKKFMERALFWIELQTAFVTLFALEQMNADNKEFKKKLIVAKTNLVKKLTEYGNSIMSEII